MNKLSITALFILALFAGSSALANDVSVSTNTSIGIGTTDKRDDKGRDELKARLRGEMDVSITERSRTRAIAEIDRRIASLQKLEARVDAMKRISASSKTALKATLDAQVDILVDLKAKIKTADDATLKTYIQSITKSYRIYMLVMPQAAVLAHADRTMTTADLMSTLGTKLDARIETARQAGTDVSILVASSTNMKAHSASAKVDAQAAIDLSVNLKADNGSEIVMKANQKALQDARAKLKSAQDHLKAARKDAQSIVVALKLKGEVKIEKN